MTELEAIQSEESLMAHMEGAKRKANDHEAEKSPLEEYTYRSKRQKLNNGSEFGSSDKSSSVSSVRRGRVGYQESGILRTKPGMDVVVANVEACKSDADKLNYRQSRF